MKKSTTAFWATLLFCLSLIVDTGAQTRRKVIKASGDQILVHGACEISGPLAEQALAANFRHLSGGRHYVPFEMEKDRFLAVSVVWYAKNWDPSVDAITLDFYIVEPTASFQIHPDGHAPVVGNRYVSELMFLEEDALLFGFIFKGPTAIDSLEIHFFDPGVSRLGQPPVSVNFPTSERAACTCPQPPLQGRLDWCPDGSCPTDPTPEFVPDPTHVIVHHTAGTNVASDWAAVVRSIWDFHVNTNGWDDIGYNWIVDPNGVLYEGRGDGRLGAHFCAQNGNTTGVCVMGDFTSIEPTSAAVGMLSQFLAWETCDENIDPLGTSFHNGSGLTLKNISGHRDGCQTSCPGDMFYPMLPAVRESTSMIIATGCDSNAPAPPTILAVTFVGQGTVGLTWQDNAVGETAYVLERSIHTNDDFQLLAQLPPNTTSHWDDTVQDGNTYYYRVKAVANSVPSPFSNEAIVQTGITGTSGQLLSAQTVRLYPNPTNGKMTVSIGNPWVGKTSVAVFDGLGRAVAPVFYQEKNTEQQLVQLDLANLPAGMYWVKLVQDGATGVFKLVKN